MPPKCKFHEGERVLCYHGPLIYEAKCLKYSIDNEKQIKYFIHYAGWNKNWDEWVPENRVLKYNESNVQRQLEVQRTHSNQPANRSKKGVGNAKVQNRRSDISRDKDKDSDSRASTPISALERTPSRASKSSGTFTPTSSYDSSLDVPRKKRSRGETSGETEEFLTKVEVQITLTDDLKTLLLDENEAITKNRKLATLPMKNNVDRILNDYVESLSTAKVTSLTRESIVEITKGIREYFNAALSLQLLYKWERPQFEDIINENSEVLPSEVYGPFHLLRLFVKLGNMLSYATLDERSIQCLTTHFHKFLSYLENNSSKIFNIQQDYKDAPPEYHRKFQ